MKKPPTQYIQAITVLFYLIAIAIFSLLQSQFKTKQLSSQISQIKLLNQTEQLNNSTPIKNKKVILLIIDAARYNYWQEIPAIKNLVQHESNNTLLLKSYVSQPTMTTQKIQTLMTGSQIFSSLNILSSFFSSPITIDNIISQLTKNNSKTAILGDDTWIKLFNFSIQYPCTKSFDIWDWQSCDQIIYNNFISQLANNNSFTIAHFLSLDHIGHASSSIIHPAFQIHKNKISNFIGNIVEKIDDSHVLMVTGDHGMRDDGNHGGATNEEAFTFLFAYSKQDNLKKLNQVSQEIRQPDITATLSLLLNIPIPMNSIGIPIFIPTSFISHNQPQLSQRQLYTNLYQHFSKMISQHNIKCQGQFTISNNNLTNEKISTLSDGIYKIRQNCLSHLAHKQLDILQIIQFLIFIVCIIVVLCYILLNICLTECIAIILIAVPHSFSWYLIRNSSTYYLISLLALVLLQIKKAGKNIWQPILIILFFCQLQPQKSGEYNINILHNQLASKIFTSPLFCMFVTLVFCGNILYLSIVPQFKNIKATIKHCSSDYYGYYFYYLYLTVFSLISLSYVLKQLQAVQARVTVNIVLTFITAISLIINGIFNKGQYTLKTLIYYMTIFLGDSALPLSFAISLLLSFFIVAQANSPYCYALAHFTWWILGNRYEYSSIDIAQSYIFSTSYHQLLNPLCLCIYMVAPYIFVLLAFCQLPDIRYIRKRKTTTNIPSDEKLQQQQIQVDPPQNSNTTKQKHLILTVLPSMLLQPLLWIVCCFINLTYNFQKILYTIVYVPMTVIEVGKIFIMIGITTVVMQCYLAVKCIQ